MVRLQIYRPRPFYLDHLTVQEDLRQGEAVRRFAVRIQSGASEQTITMFEGRNIGHKAICRFPLVCRRKVWLEITEADRPVRLRQVALHNTSGLTPYGKISVE